MEERNTPVIDAHVHFTPPSMLAQLESVAEKEPYWGFLTTADGHNHTQQGWATPERMIEDMDRAGIDRVVLIGEYRQHHDECVKRNDAAIEITSRWPDRVTAFACIQPAAGRAAIEELDRCLDAGMKGVGELNPYGQGFSTTDPEFLRFLGYCEQKGALVNIHVSEPVGHYYFGKSTTTPLEFWELARRFPELVMILAHWGGGLFFFEIMPEVRQELRNVYYDTAGTPLLYPTDRIFEVALQCVGPDKILYASDYPLLTVPDEQDQPDFLPFLRQIQRLGLSSEVQDAIMGGNVARLLERSLVERPAGAAPAGASDSPITRFTPVAQAAQSWPETRPLFDEAGIPWRNSPVPFWEPIAQAAAAKGMPTARVDELIAALNDRIR